MVGKAGILTVLGFALILGFISLNIVRLAKSSTATMSSYTDGTLSHTLAQTGANIGLARFYADTTWHGDTTQNFNGPHFFGSVRYFTTIVGPNAVRLRSISTYRSPSTPIAEMLHDTVDVYFNNNRTQTFSIFAWMTNNENGVNWTTADTVWGRVHSNSTLTISGRPVFYEKVTTTRGFNKPPGTSPNYAIFKKGYETGVASVDFPSDLSGLYNAANDTTVLHHGKYFADSIWVTLNPGDTSNGNGKAYIRKNSFSSSIVDSIQLSDTTFDGVLGAYRNIHVKGSLDGKLSLASFNGSVVVEDTIRYERNPQARPSDDLLGLIAEKNVIVADNAANNSDCAIDACVFAKSGSFAAQGYNRGPLFGNLYIYGSIVQNTRGAVGTISGTTLVTGFSKRYRYDSRLSDPNFRPPYFPGYFVRTYAITNWWESFRVPNINQ